MAQQRWDVDGSLKLSRALPIDGQYQRLRIPAPLDFIKHLESIRGSDTADAQECETANEEAFAGRDRKTDAFPSTPVDTDRPPALRPPQMRLGIEECARGRVITLAALAEQRGGGREQDKEVERLIGKKAMQ